MGGKWVWTISLAGVLGAGCASHNGGAEGPGPTPSAAYGAYPAPQTPAPLQEEAPPTGAPPGVSTVDITVGKEISRMLREDEHLGPVSADVAARVDHGVVTLLGNVPAEHDRIEIVERVSKLPGVDRVEDRLRVTGER